MRSILVIALQPFYEDRDTPIVVCETLEILSKLGYAVDVATFPIGREVAFQNVRLFRTKNLLITFDDSYLDFMTCAWPLLERHGFSALVFLVAGEVGGWNR